MPSLALMRTITREVVERAIRVPLIGDGAASVNATLLRDAINEIVNAGGGDVLLPRGYFPFNADDVFFHHDAVDNPDFPADASLQGRVRLIGEGSMDQSAYDAGFDQGTILDCGSQTLTIGDGTLNLRGSRLESLTLIANNATRVVDFKKTSRRSGWLDVLIVQKGAGNCVDMSDCFYIEAGFAWLYKDGAVSGTGLNVWNPNQSASLYEFRNVSAKGFAKGRVFGVEGAAASSMRQVFSINCQSIDCDEGLLIARGCGDSYWINEHIEGCAVLGVRIWHNAARHSFDHPTLNNPAATEADFVLGKSGEADANNRWSLITLDHPHFVAINAKGLSAFLTASCKNLDLRLGRFVAGAAGVGTGIDFNGGSNLHNVTLDRPEFSNLATDISSLAAVDYYRAADTLGRVSHKAPHTFAGHAETQVNVASATNVAWIDTANVWRITGTTTINTIAAPTDGSARLTLIFSAAVTVNDESTSAGNIALAGGANFAAGADDTLDLVWNTTAAKWHQVGRSDN